MGRERVRGGGNCKITYQSGVKFGCNATITNCNTFLLFFKVYFTDFFVE